MGGLFVTIYFFVKFESTTFVGRSLHVGWDFQVQLSLQLQTAMQKGSANICVDEIQPKLGRLRNTS